MRLPNTPWRRPRGVTLIEIVLTLALFGLGASAIAALLTGGLNINQTNNQSRADVRDAASCYETILAVHETNQWSESAPTPLDECPTDWTEVSKNQLESWVNNAAIEDALSEVCAVPDRQAGSLECRYINVASEPATQFRIAVNQGQSIDLIVP